MIAPAEPTDFGTRMFPAALNLFEHGSIVTNGSYGFPYAPGRLVTLSLDGPPEQNDAIRGVGVFARVIALNEQYPTLVKASVATLDLMKSDRCADHTGDNCALKSTLPLYVGEGGVFERTFCCYGNDVDCERCGAYAVFNAARNRE